ncbi:MAG: hypothetical protein COA93_12515 [Alphaproteobacteria bacterium]|nr:MAG: hypothetical protein COA93_12515 [Alphaproteobacteria bacterium]
MQELLRRELSVSHRRQTVLSFVYFGIDNFKAINDKFGHIEGDDVLKYIGKIMKKIVREVDIPCRYGGDEFCLILPDCANEDAEIICQRLIKAFNEVYPEYTLSIGISEASPHKHVDSQELIKIADGKMYLAKKETGSNICN